MCGLIAGGKGAPDVAEVGMMLEHRGVRCQVRDNVVHWRMPVVGVGPEHDQPVKVGSWLVAWVGEVLDFRDRYPGMECDTELVCREWEDASFVDQRHDGFWSIAAVYLPTGSLHLLADYLGQKPLYYRTDCPVAASEPDPVAAVMPTTLDELYLSDVCKWGYCPDARRTPYCEVNRVLPGEHVMLDRGCPPRFLSRDVLRPRRICDKEVLRDAICVAIRLRVTSSDVPVAALVSGGLDSSIVYTLASRYADVKPYYVVTDDPSEHGRIQDLVGSRLTYASASSVTTEEALQVMQEPLDLGSLKFQVALARVVDERVCLTGDGADELLGGYSRSLRYDSQASDVWRELVCWHLPRLDRVMMSNMVETRSPFLSRSVAEIALGLPRAERTNKKILRDLFPEFDVEKVPLRPTSFDREATSVEMVDMFRRRYEEAKRVSRR